MTFHMTITLSLPQKVFSLRHRLEKRTEASERIILREQERLKRSKKALAYLESEAASIKDENHYLAVENRVTAILYA